MPKAETHLAQRELQRVLDYLRDGGVYADFEILTTTGLPKKVLRSLLRGLVVLEWIEEVDRVEFGNGAGASTYRITKLGRMQILEDLRSRSGGNAL